MVKNYFKIAWRSIWKNRGYSLLNIFGLAVGIACASLIFLWVEDEVNFNDYFANNKLLYKVKDHQTYDGTTFTFDATPGLLAGGLNTDFPGVENTARTTPRQKQLFSLGEKHLYSWGNYVDASFLQMFQLNFIEGNAENAFNQLNNIVITKGFASKIFGSSEKYIGKTFEAGEDQVFVVSGVVEDLPDNVSFDFEWLAPFKIYENENEWLQNWVSNGIFTYAQLETGADPSAINKKLYDYIDTKHEGAVAKMELYPMARWRLYNTFDNGKEVPGRIKYVKLFSLIACAILVIACINFMNLSTARSQNRAREVGVRKVLGTSRGSLINQFLGESVLTALFAMVLAVGLLYAALPLFNNLVDKNLSIQLFDPLHLSVLTATALLCGLLAGVFPAFYLSSFKPVKVFKGLSLKEGSASWVRKGLVVVQFSVSILLIISTVLIYQQIQHVKARNMGFDKEHLIYLNANVRIQDHFDLIKNELLKTGYVSQAAMSTSEPLSKGNNTANFDWEGKDPNKQVLITTEGVTPDYIQTLGMKIKTGRDFYSNSQADSLSVLINQSFADIIDDENVIGSVVEYGNQPLTVIGIMEDFVYNNMYGNGAPLVFYQQATANYLNIRFKKNANLEKALAATEAIFKRSNPGSPFEYNFVDEQFDDSFKTETLIGELASVFAVLAIFISCLGLFGLAAYTAEQRTREIGVRKVLGASVQHLVSLLSLDFLKLVLVSCLIALPLGWYVMNSWLQDYAYRISISWWVLVLAGASALLIALITVSFQAIKAAVANPVKSIRTE